MRITGDNPEGKAELDQFIDPESRYPVIVTTSKLMTTGIDAQTCKLIVLDRNIQSIPEFKQIIGRGTRINEDFGKYYFTIIDFRKATELFADPQFDGDPVVIFTPKPDESPAPPEDSGDSGSPDSADDDSPITDSSLPEGHKKRVKYVVGDVPVYVIAERVQYYSKDGKLITESLKDYTRKRVHEAYTSLDSFLKRWSSTDQKRAIIQELEKHGILLEALSEEVGKDFDPFDLICHVVFGRPALTRRERAAKVRKRDYFTQYGEQARAVLDALLDKYADEGIENIEDIKVLNVQPFKQLGTPVEIVKHFGGPQQYKQAVRELEAELYAAA